jgi:hypothetical protein
MMDAPAFDSLSELAEVALDRERWRAEVNSITFGETLDLESAFNLELDDD